MRTRFDSAAGGGLALPSLTPVVKWLLIVNIGIFLLTWFVRTTPGVVATIYGTFGVDASRWFEGPLWFPIWQVLTYGFFHSVHGFGHILWNSLQLYFFGTLLEGLLGGRRFLFLYLVGMIVAGVASLLLGFAMGGLPVVGASGAILAVVVALAVRQPDTPVILLFIPIALKWLAIGLVAIDLLQFLGTLGGRETGVAHLAHLSGAAFGFLAARRGWIWIDPLQALEKRRRRKQNEKAADDARRLDALLARIHREGIDALSQREREFLKRMSKRP